MIKGAYPLQSVTGPRVYWLSLDEMEQHPMCHGGQEQRIGPVPEAMQSYVSVLHCITCDNF